MRNAGTGDNDTVKCSGNTRGDDGDEFVFLGVQQSYYTKQNFINNVRDFWLFFITFVQKQMLSLYNSGMNAAAANLQKQNSLQQNTVV